MSSFIEKKNISRIAIIAGSGKTPHLVHKSAHNIGWTGCVIKLEGFAEEYFYNWKTFEFPVGKISSILKKLNEEKITDVVICGGVERGRIKNFTSDYQGIKLLSKVAFRGDDGASKIICEYLENEGLKIHSLNKFILNSNTPKGHFGGPKPSQLILNDIKKGIEVLNILSSADICQSIVVQNGLILSIEAIEGTDKLIKRSFDLKFPGIGPVLVKASKISQEMKIDQPVIGPNTIQNVKKSCFSCVACEVDKVLIIDFEETLKIANKENISLYGFIN